jgi:hypothetical protein
MKAISVWVPTTAPRRPIALESPARRQNPKSTDRCSHGQAPVTLPTRVEIASMTAAADMVPSGGVAGPSPPLQATPTSIAPTPRVTAATGWSMIVPSAIIAATGTAATMPWRSEMRPRSTSKARGIALRMTDR